MVDIATRMMFGEKLVDQGYGVGLYPESDHVAVKVPVFSFEKLHDVDTHLGPEMKSTGEVLGIAKTFEEALYKGLVAAGYKMEDKAEGKGVLISVRDSDKQEIIKIAEKFENLGYDLYATGGTASLLNRNFVATSIVKKIGEGEPNIMDLINSGKLAYIISTSKKGRQPQRHSVQLRRKAVERSIPCLTALDTANALADSLKMNKKITDVELINIAEL